MNDKPTPPDDTYEVMLGRDVPSPVPALSMYFNTMSPSKWVISNCTGNRTVNSCALDMWYAVPKSALTAKPNEEADPYAELKAAHAAGKVIQIKMPRMWSDLLLPDWSASPENYRIKPEPDADGWIPHKPGDEMPCDGAERVQVKFRDGHVPASPTFANLLRWDHKNNSSAIIAWRPANAAAPEESSAAVKESLTAEPPSLCPSHYAGAVTPWDLERCMKSSGNAFVDSRRTDAIEYCFRMKHDLLGDLKKARHCIDEAIKQLETTKA